MKIAFFHAYPQHYAGSQRLTHALARVLLAAGHKAAIVLPDEGPFADRLRADSIPVVIVPAPAAWRTYGRALERHGAARAIAGLPGYWRSLRTAFASLNPDVVHLNDHRGALLAGVPAVLVRAPVVWHLHGVYGSFPITVLGRAVARRIVIVSEATRHEQRWLHGAGSKIVVIHNAVIDLAPDEDRTASAPGASGANRLVVTGARQHPDKGLDVLIRASRILRDRGLSFHVVIAGAVQPGYEHHHRELVDLVRELALEDTVSLPGYVENPLELWRDADLYVQPSRREPFGLGVIEAMSVGTPVITSAVGGMTEIVEPGRSGLLVSPDSPPDLADAICRVLGDPHLASELRTQRVTTSQGVFAARDGRSSARLIPRGDRMTAPPQAPAQPRLLRAATSVTMHTIMQNQLALLREAGFSVQCVCDDDEWTDAIRALGVEVVPLGMGRRPGPIQALSWGIRFFLLLKRQRVDIVHTHNAFHGLIGRPIARLAGVPVIVQTIHNWWYLAPENGRRARAFLLFERFAAQFSDAVLFLNRDDERRAVGEKIVPPERIHFIGNGINTRAFERLLARNSREQARQRLDAGSCVIITMIARLEAPKDHETLLRAFAKLVADHEDTRLLVAGQGLEEHRVRSLARSLGLDEHIRFLGHVSDVPALLKATDILVLSSQREGVPRSVIEGMVARLPVVGSDAPGIRDAIDAGQTGYLFPPGDVEALHDALECLIRDPAARQRMGEAGYHRAMTSFDEASVVMQTTELYRSLLAQKRLSTGQPSRRRHAALVSVAGRSPTLGRVMASLWRRGIVTPPSGTIRVRTRVGTVMEFDLGDRVQRMMALSRFEPRETLYVQSKLRSGDTFLDVGGHVGWFSTLAGLCVGRGGLVCVVEPFPANIARLRVNLALNGVQAMLAEVAAAGEEGTVAIGQQRGSDSGSVTAGPRAADHLIRVRCAPLDVLFADVPAIRLLKIDAEGSELGVLDGAQQLLSRTEAVLIELNTSALASVGASPSDIVDRLEACGFDLETVFDYPQPGMVNAVFSRRGTAGGRV